jgi:hypothetical protein
MSELTNHKWTAHRRAAFWASLLISVLAVKAGAADYSVYANWAAMDQATDAKYATAHRISGTNGYTGFWFFGAEQFDVSNRYALAMTVYCMNRDVTKDDVADIGFILDHPPGGRTLPATNQAPTAKQN